MWTPPGPVCNATIKVADQVMHVKHIYKCGGVDGFGFSFVNLRV